MGIRKLSLVLVALFALVFAGCPGGDFHSKDAIHKEIGVVQSQVDILNQKIIDLQLLLDSLVSGIGDNTIVVIDQDTINQIFADITALQEQIAALEAELTELQGEVGDLDDRLTALEEKCAEVDEALAGINERLTALEAAVLALQNGSIPPRTEGGPAYVFSGAGNPTDGVNDPTGALFGDFYIDLNESQTGSHLMYFYNGETWVYFGQIFKANGPSARPTLVQ